VQVEKRARLHHTVDSTTKEHHMSLPYVPDYLEAAHHFAEHQMPADDAVVAHACVYLEEHEPAVESIGRAYLLHRMFAVCDRWFLDHRAVHAEHGMDPDDVDHPLAKESAVSRILMILMAGRSPRIDVDTMAGALERLHLDDHIAEDLAGYAAQLHVLLARGQRELDAHDHDASS
jgi:hypothetical protein